MTELTIEQLEALIQQRQESAEQRRAKLLRLISAYARVIALVTPDEFIARATEYADEDGHWDNSYPPKQKYKNRCGPRAIQVREYDWDQIATSRGFYYDFKCVPTDLGLYVDRKGVLWGGSLTGTGRFGQYAAHPGYCDVNCTIEWDTLDTDDIELTELEVAEAKLRQKAFPLLTAAQP